MSEHPEQGRTVILGAGVAGLSGASFLQQQGIPCLVLEQSAECGGLARSFRWHGFWCDFAAHRFFTRDPEVLSVVQSLVPLHHHQRRSQIFFRGSWMHDPIDIVQLMRRLPTRERLRLVQSYLARDPHLPETSFEAFVIRRYGPYLYDSFFRPYTERLFGLRGDQIDVEWARRKVRLASPWDRLMASDSTKKKFSTFYYPVHGGYGAIAHRLLQDVQAQVLTNARVTGFERDGGGRITAVLYDHQGSHQRVAADRVISTLPATVTARFLGVPLPLEYQKVQAVYLLLKKPWMTPNHWLYFMDPASVINRLVEFKHMSANDTDPETTVVCAEVTCSPADPARAVVENLVRSTVITPDEVLDTLVLREPFSYPRYQRGYGDILRTFMQHPDQPENLSYAGRAAQFDHLEVDDLIGTMHTLVRHLTTGAPVPAALERAEPAPPAGEVWIVVLAWNNYQDTAECLASLRHLAYPTYRVVLVDNGSEDGTPDRVRETFPEVTVLENGVNLGVPAGYNVGFRYALEQGAAYVLMLNNDTVVDPALLAHLVVAAREPGAGILAPIFYYYDEPDQVWASGARYRRLPPAIVFEQRVFPRPEAGGYHELQYAISCGLLITREAFERAGFFDENYRFLWDDYDFSERVRRHGLKILQVPAAKLWHKISRTTRVGSRLYWQVHGESGAIFYRRHGRLGALSLAVHLGYFALRETFWNRHSWRFLMPYVQGLTHGATRPLKAVPRIKDELSYPG